MMLLDAAHGLPAVLNALDEVSTNEERERLLCAARALAGQLAVDVPALVYAAEKESGPAVSDGAAPAL